MNKNNATLTADEQINLQLNDQKEGEANLNLTQNDVQQYYSLEDLFNMSESLTANNVFAVIIPFENEND